MTSFFSSPCRGWICFTILAPRLKATVILCKFTIEINNFHLSSVSVRWCYFSNVFILQFSSIVVPVTKVLQSQTRVKFNWVFFLKFLSLTLWKYSWQIWDGRLIWGKNKKRYKSPLIFKWNFIFHLKKIKK